MGRDEWILGGASRKLAMWAPILWCFSANLLFESACDVMRLVLHLNHSSLLSRASLNFMKSG